MLYLCNTTWQCSITHNSIDIKLDVNENKDQLSLSANCKIVSPKLNVLSAGL